VKHLIEDLKTHRVSRRIGADKLHYYPTVTRSRTPTTALTTLMASGAVRDLRLPDWIRPAIGSCLRKPACSRHLRAVDGGAQHFPAYREPGDYVIERASWSAEPLYFDFRPSSGTKSRGQCDARFASGRRLNDRLAPEGPRPVALPRARLRSARPGVGRCTAGASQGP